MDLEELDVSGIREAMLAEMEHDLDQDELYVSPRLTQAGTHQYPGLLRAALAGGTVASFARALEPWIRDMEDSTTAQGRRIEKKVPWNAADTLAEGEFNRFYCRAVCCVAIELGKRVVIYRAKDVETPREESEARIGFEPKPAAVLSDLRRSQRVEPSLGVPAGPNSGLSLRFG